MERWTNGRSRIIFIGFVFAATVAACGGGDDAVEVSGSTGTCDLPGDVLTCETETSDDRVSGIAEIAIQCELTEDGDTTVGDCTGPAIVTNDGGTWEGTCEGTTTWSTSEPDHVHNFDCTYLGTGDYEGLRYVEHLEGVYYPWPIAGRIEPIE